MHSPESWSVGLWFEATFAVEPLVSLVYPNVYPTKVDCSESEGWRGLQRVFRFRPSHQITALPHLKVRVFTRMLGSSKVRYSVTGG